jgi:hypothetical protein
VISVSSETAELIAKIFENLYFAWSEKAYISVFSKAPSEMSNEK